MARRTGGSPVTVTLMGALVLVWLASFAPFGLVSSLLPLVNLDVYSGEIWRLFTVSLTSGGLLGVLMNLLVLWITGRALESAVGGVRLLVLYGAAGLGGATLFFCLGPLGGVVAYGSYAAVIGLLAAHLVLKHRQRVDIRTDVGLLVLLVLYNIAVNFAGLGWTVMIGGGVVGLLAGSLISGRSRRSGLLSALGLAAIVVACLVAVAARILLI